MIKGLFLYFDEAPYNEKIQTVLQELNRALNLDIQARKVNSTIISNLVPDTLQDVESWLILYHPDDERGVLIVPFLLVNDLPSSNMLENVRDNIALQFGRLIEWDNRHSLYYHTFRNSEFIRGFVYLRDVSISSLLDPDQSEQQRQNDILLQETSNNIQQLREQQLREVFPKIINTTNSTNSEILVALDEEFLKENNELFKELTSHGIGEVVPNIVKDFKDIMDAETRKFLITSETVKNFAHSSSFANFDYSAPGCGLWKAVERELNLSLIAHMRREVDIIKNINRPWEGSHMSRAVPILAGDNRSENLNQREKDPPQELKGIMLGPMKFMCELGHCNSVKEKLEHLSLSPSLLNYFLGNPEKRAQSQTNSLPRDLHDVTKLRNGHAHISAMTSKKFDELYKLVLQPLHGQKICFLGKILEFKRTVIEYWKAKGDC